MMMVLKGDIGLHQFLSIVFNMWNCFTFEWDLGEFTKVLLVGDGFAYRTGWKTRKATVTVQETEGKLLNINGLK